ncbi:MAG TPA: hypothetical protein VMY35_15720 [Phycisphaerae bacterium]|nr:hypothetical protein [Phycisphaerae bacterium]
MNDSLPTLPDSPGASRRRRLALVALATAGVCAYLAAWTIGSRPILGDEARHFRRAANYWTALDQTHSLRDFLAMTWRVDHDPAFPKEGPGAVPYYDASLWHMGLALFWRVVGYTSLVGAQLYHASFVFLLGVATYLAGRALGGHRAGLWAWALVLTIPMNVLFGMAFYQEMPFLAFTAAAVACVLAGRGLRSAAGLGAALGLALAAMFLTKSPVASVLIPPILAATILRPGDTWAARLLRTAVALAVGLALLVPDMLWHMEHFGQPLMIRYYATPLSFPGLDLPSPKMSAVPLSIGNPVAVLEMFGASGLVAAVLGSAIAVYAVWRSAGDFVRDLLRRRLRALARLPDSLGAWTLLAALPLGAYLAAYVVMLRRAYDVRYLHPATLMLCLLAARPLSRLPLRRAEGGRWIGRAAAIVLLLAMAGQLLSVPPTVWWKLRRLPPETEAAYTWIRLHTPEDARILYNEESLMAMTGRPLIWAAAVPRYLFSTTERNQARVLRYFEVQYLAIHPTRRIADWSPDIEPTGYPESWLKTLPDRPYLERVYPPPGQDSRENDFLLYRVDYDRIPAEWIADVEPGAWRELVEEERRRSEGRFHKQEPPAP